MLNYEVPRESISKLSSSFKMLEDNKAGLNIEDYVLSQSTLEQVFLKQIRPNEKDLINQKDQQEINDRVPNLMDYINGYLMLLLALFIPGLHHFYLGNFYRGLKYFFTYNEVVAGWLLDIFELHILIQQSVQQYGHINNGEFFLGCKSLFYCCCCCFTKPKENVIDETNNNEQIHESRNDAPIINVIHPNSESV